MRFLPLIALILLVGCAPVPAPMSASDPDAYPPWPSTTADEAAKDAACAARGGLRLARIGKAQTLTCIVSYRDAGKACTDGSQCLGKRCTGEFEDMPAASPATGTCAATNNPFGCNTIIEAGVARTICVD